MKNALWIAIAGITSTTVVTTTNASSLWVEIRDTVVHAAPVVMPPSIIPILVYKTTIEEKPVDKSLGEIVKPIAPAAEWTGKGLVHVFKGVGDGISDVAEWWEKNNKGFVSDNNTPASISDAVVAEQVWGLNFVTDASGAKVVAYWRPIETGGPTMDLCSLKLADVEYFNYTKVGVIKSPFGGYADQYQISYKAKKR